MRGGDFITILTSYFYKIRFFKPNHIPFSTAVWDPKWYHAFKSQSYTFLDKRGVLNGLRQKDFMPGPNCCNLCRGIENCISKNPDNCEFLSKYYEQLNKLDATKIIRYFNNVLCKISDKMNLTEDPIPILIVHESPSNLCSERCVIQRVLKEKGIECYEL